jgi:HPt (histidine-containing phosphotransfer) domain-containing protein
MQTVDVKAAHQALGDLPAAVISSIISALETDVVRLVQQMDVACRGCDTAALRFAAHGLAGVAATFGARHLEALARRAMHSAGECSMDLLGGIKAEASVAMAEVKQVFDA